MVRKLLCGVAVALTVTATVVGGYFLPHPPPPLTDADAGGLPAPSMPLSINVIEHGANRVPLALEEAT